MNIKHCAVAALRYFRILPHILVEAYGADYETGRVNLGDPDVSAWFRRLHEAQGFADSIVHDAPVGPSFALVAVVNGLCPTGFTAEVQHESCLAGTSPDWGNDGLRLIASA